MEKVIDIKALDNYKLFLKYENGVEGVIDLNDIVGKGVFEKFNDVSYYKNVKVGEFGEPNWNDELDIDPTSAYIEIKGITYEQYLNNKK
jgi:hypothetical protein